MDYKKKLKTRLYTAIAYIFIGIIFSVLYFCGVSENQSVLSLGIALIVMGILRIRQYMKITKDDESIRKQRIAETDERNIAILHKAKSVAFGLYVFIVAIVVIILELLGKSELSTILALNVCAIVLLYWICYWIYQKKL